MDTYRSTSTGHGLRRSKVVVVLTDAETLMALTSALVKVSKRGLW